MYKNYLLLFLLSIGVMTAHAQLTDVITGLDFPFGLALDGTDLYFTEASAGEIAKIDISMENPLAETVVSGLGGPLALVQGGGELFFFDNSPERIVRYDIASNTSSVLVSDLGNVVTGLFLDGDNLYLSLNEAGQIGRVDISAANPTVEIVATGFFQPDGLARRGDVLYVAEFGNNRVSAVDLTASLPTTPTPFVTGLDNASGLTLDGDYLYIANSTSLNRVQISADNPAAELVVDGLDGSRLVAINQLDLYIAQVGNAADGAGKISKFPLNAAEFNDQGAVCMGDTPTDLGGASPTGGVYTGNGVTDNGDGETFTFSSDDAGMGVTIVTYTISGASSTANVEVVTPPTVTFTVPGPFDIGDGVQALTGGMPTGGTYTGAGVMDNNFDPAAVGAGSYEITYTFTDQNGCSGSAVGMITVSGGGVAASALNFDGVNDYVALPDALRTAIPADVSVEAWFKAENFVGGSSIVHNLEWTSNGSLFSGYAISMLGGNGGVEGIIATVDNGLIRVQYNDISLDQWYHVAMTYDGISARLYIDGQEVNSTPASGAINYSPVPLGFNIGYYEDTNESVFFDGDIDEVRIWGRALSCFEIEQQYSCELSGSEQDLVAYYQFNQGTADGDNSAITELTATTGPNGTLTDFALMGTTSNFVESGGVTTGVSCSPVMSPSFDLSSDGTTVPPNSTLDLGEVMVGENGIASIQIDAFQTSFSTAFGDNSLFSIVDFGESFNVVFTPNNDNLGPQTAFITIALEDCLGISVFGFEVTATGTETVVSDCPENLVLLSQAEVADFLVQYPDCTELPGYLKIGDSETDTDITDLTPLSNLLSVGGTISIFLNSNLTTLNGLNNIVTIGGNLGLWRNFGLSSMEGLESLTTIGGSLNVHGNDSMVDFEGLNNLSSIGDRMDVEANFSLQDFTGLESLTSIGGFTGISNHPSLTSLNGLSSLTSIGFAFELKANSFLENVDGLSSLASVNGNLNFKNNISLTNVDGLSSLASVNGNLSFLSNSSLVSLMGMSSLTSINGFLVIRSNAILPSLAGLENIDPAGITRLFIVANPELSTCDIESICSYLSIDGSLANIAGNNKDCARRGSVEEACNEGGIIEDINTSMLTGAGYTPETLVEQGTAPSLSADGISVGTTTYGGEIKLYPNPTSSMLQVRNVLAQRVIVFNPQGQQVAQFNNPGTELDISGLSAGVYYLNFLTAEGSITRRVVKVD